MKKQPHAGQPQGTRKDGWGTRGSIPVGVDVTCNTCVHADRATCAACGKACEPAGGVSGEGQYCEECLGPQIAENDAGESYEQAAPVPSRKGDTCYVCGKSEGLRECKHCGSTVCKDSLYAGELCPLCAAMKSNMAQDAQRRLARRNEEVERASELAARAAALAGYDAGVTAAIMQIEDRAKSAPGVAGDVLNAMARELAASIKPGVRHV